MLLKAQSARQRTMATMAFIGLRDHSQNSEVVSCTQTSSSLSDSTRVVFASLRVERNIYFSIQVLIHMNLLTMLEFSSS